jgi:hypothetical protein
MGRLALLVVLLVALGGLVVQRSTAAQFDPEQLRFRLVGDEPIAGPDGKSTVSGSKVLVFRDMKRNECFVTFVLPSGTSTVSAGVCP